MICRRINPSPSLLPYIKEYLILHLIFGKDDPAPVKSYPVNPEEGFTFLLKGSLAAETPELASKVNRPDIILFGQPNFRQNFFISREYFMVHVRFQPGAMFRWLRIPMSEFVHQAIDAQLLVGRNIKFLSEQMADAKDYSLIPTILNTYFQKELFIIKESQHPVDRIAEMILQNPQHFNLDKVARDACLSHRQFEKRFLAQIGITPKYFSRICRFYQAYELKETRPGLDWLSIAVRTGYSDYQHLVKDFKQFAGTTPNSLIKECELNPERRLQVAKDFVGL